jgi:hypothetical protein
MVPSDAISQRPEIGERQSKQPDFAAVQILHEYFIGKYLVHGRCVTMPAMQATHSRILCRLEVGFPESRNHDYN